MGKADFLFEFFELEKVNNMSIQGKCFDEEKAKAELKKCPKIVRDYVKLLTESRDRWQELTNKAIAKLKNPQP